MYSSILHRNAMAVNALRSCNYPQAGSLLTSALKDLSYIQHQQEEIILDQQSRQPSDTTTAPAGAIEVSLENNYFSIERAVIPTTSHDCPGATCCEVFPFFNRALTICFKNKEEENSLLVRSSTSDDESLLQARIALVLLYNLGLTYHVPALQSGASSSHYLTMALEFYRNAMMLMASSSSATTTTKLHVEIMDNKNGLVILLAVLNNMGHIYAALINHEGASNCLTMLKDCLDEAVAIDDDDDDDDDHAGLEAGGLSDDESLFFYITTFVFPSWQLRFAPAA